MPSSWELFFEKLKSYGLQFASILLDGAFIVAWWFAQHGLKWALLKVGSWFGPEYVVEGQDHWLILTAHGLVAWSTLIVLCIYLLLDLLKLALYAFTEVCILVSEIRKKFFG